MFIPVGDTPNPRNFTPWMNWFLIAANVVIYVLVSMPLATRGVSLSDPLLKEYIQYMHPSLPSLLALRRIIGQVSAYDLFVFSHGFKPGSPEISDLFFSLFLHGSFLHLAGNMLFLWIYGDNTEHRLGRVGYVLTYLTTGVAATLFFGLFAGKSMVPLIGASGAISGVLGLYFLLFPRNKVKMFIALFPFFFNTILLPARWVLGIYILFDNLLPFLSGAASGVAYGAHLGGFLAGLVIAGIGERFAWRWPWSDTFWRLGSSSAKRQSHWESEEGSPFEAVRSALVRHESDKAIEAFAQMNREEISRLRPNDCVVLANWLEDAGHPIAATRLLRNCLAKHQRAENLADVYLLLGLMRLRQGQPTAAYQYLLSVLDYDPGPETATRARQALRQIDSYRRQQ